MQRLVFLFLILALVSCSNGAGEADITESPALVPTLTVPIEVSTPEEQTAIPQVTSVETAVEPSATPEPELPWDLSGVTLVEATHLMDPANFQISMDNWPEDLPEETRVFVDADEFNCDILFQEQYPHRVYCWGQAPRRGEIVTIRVFLPDLMEPVLEIPLIVPAPGGG